MRPVCRVPPLTDAGLAEPEDLVFPFDGEGASQRTLPYEQSTAAAFESIRQLEAILQPASDAQMMVSGNSAADGAGAPVKPLPMVGGVGIGRRRHCNLRSSVPGAPMSRERRAAGAYLRRRRAPAAAAHLPLTYAVSHPFLPALQLARHVELACGGAHRVEPGMLAAVLQRLGYSAKLHDSVCLGCVLRLLAAWRLLLAACACLRTLDFDASSAECCGSRFAAAAALTAARAA